MTANLNKKNTKKVLMVVANKVVSPITKWPVGFWAAELTHAWYEFTEAGYDVTIASPMGGKVEFDALSDPRDQSGYSKHDIISMGFINTLDFMKKLDNTPSLKDLKEKDYDAIVVVGGQAPMITFKDEKTLQELFTQFYNAGKPSAALCHGTSLLLYLKNKDGAPFVKGKTMTGFADSEEKYAEEWAKMKIQPFWIETEAKKLGANFITGGMFKPFAIRDGNLITGQQQYSGRATAKLVIEALGV
jgi:putative intracellular protease/amidase